MKVIIKLLVIATFACLGFHFIDYTSQANVGSKVKPKILEQENQKVKKIVKAEGWEIPLNKKFKSQVFSRIETSNETPIRVDKKYYDEEFILNFDSYQISEDGLSLFTKTYSCKPISIASLKIQNTEKIFGYSLDCTFVRLNEKGDIKRDTLVAFRFFYIDENNDGKFETKHYVFNLPNLPKWVKKMSANN